MMEFLRVTEWSKIDITENSFLNIALDSKVAVNC